MNIICLNYASFKKALNNLTLPKVGQKRQIKRSVKSVNF